MLLAEFKDEIGMDTARSLQFDALIPDPEPCDGSDKSRLLVILLIGEFVAVLVEHQLTLCHQLDLLGLITVELSADERYIYILFQLNTPLLYRAGGYTDIILSAEEGLHILGKKLLTVSTVEFKPACFFTVCCLTGVHQRSFCILGDLGTG